MQYVQFESCKIDKSDLIEFIDNEIGNHTIVAIHIEYQFSRDNIRWTRYGIFYKR